MSVLTRALVGTAALAVLAAPAALVVSNGGLALSAGSTTTPVEKRTSAAPNVFFPVISKVAKDRRLFGKRPGTEIAAPCGAVVRSATAGIAYLGASKSSGPNLVTVVTSPGRLTAYYGYMQRALVTNGQVVAAGQPIGTVGKEGVATSCSLYLAMTKSAGLMKVNPTRWLTNYVGKPVPQPQLFGNNGFTLASFNTLGARHTPTKRYPGYAVRTPKQLALLSKYNVDVVGLQELEPVQRDMLMSQSGSTYGIFPTMSAKYTANSILWRNATMELVSSSFVNVPYFDGQMKPTPIVLLRERATGRTAYFINVHNPANIGGNQAKWRARAIAIERAKIIELRATGRPVFLTGDFNDREQAFCPLTKDKLMIAANSIPSMTCAPPSGIFIDQIFAAGPARFTSYVLDWVSKDSNISDHPIVVSRVHLAE